MKVKPFWLVAVLALCQVNAGNSSAAEDENIIGTYQAGDAEFTVTKNGEVYQVRWEFPNKQVWIGVGLLEGKTLSVAWDFPDGGNLGVSVYKVEKGIKGPKLVGKWASYKDKKSTPDTITFIKK